ncbi:MAG: DEAD/DEAH box helicase, partial [Malacoplasma sp.]|nr:DEAD/DEAH box helicase [Malacoplasma sp.]
SKNDPVLQIKIYFDKILIVLVAKLSFLYGEIEYSYKENEDNYFKRERFLEQKLLEPVLNFFNYYNVEFKVFEIVDHQKYLDFIEWSRKVINNDLYEVKFSEDLIFKPKNKKEFRINSSSFENNFLKIDWQIEGFTKEDMLKIISSYQQKIKYVTLSNNKIINLELEIDFDKLNEELKLLNTSVDQINNGSVLVNKLNSNYFLENFEFENKDELKNHFEKLYGDNNEFVKNELPDNLRKILKNYQVVGYLWLKKLIYLQAGGILADEMGLGKTIQTLSLLADVYFNKKTNLPSLVVCPSSLVYNWQKEFHQYAPYLKIAIIDGNQSERLSVLNRINEYDVVVTSYHLLNKDLELYKNIEFYIQILDEAQKIKNHYTQFSKDSKSINSKHKIALTGTPIENNLLELWSIFDYLMHNFLYDYRTFKINFQEKIINKDEETLKKLKTKIAPFILRRTKKDVLKELPSKTYKILTCDFNETQKEMYFTELNKSKLVIKKEISQNTINKQSIYIFSVLTKLRQLCCSPKLIYENCETNGSKFNLCIELIKDLIKNDDKILLFSQFTSMIELIAQELKKLNISFYTLTGDTNKKERIELVNDFNNKKNVKVFLISLKAGGTGLTLTSANAVIHYDPWWNQSLENQATDRAHRIGQEKNVFIYKLIAKNSIEEKILSLQESKKEIIEQIFDENSSQKSSISMSEILKVLDIE